MCKGGGGVWVSGPQTGKHLPQSPFTSKLFKMTILCIAFYESYLSTGQGISGWQGEKQYKKDRSRQTNSELVRK
jgi:hypothetical protein